MGIEMSIHNILRRSRQGLSIANAARQIGSRYWAERIWNRYPLEEFHADRATGLLRFDRLGIDAPKEVAEILLTRYQTALDLHSLCGASFWVSNDQLFAEVEGVKAVIETEEELLILQELFLDRTYGWNLHPGTIVLDIGMNVAIASLFFVRHKDVISLGFEPFGPTFEQARRNLALNPYADGKIEIKNIGLSNVNKTDEWNYSPTNRGSCGVFGIGPEAASDTSPKLSVELREASTIVEDVKQRFVDRPLIAKIDCEGSEYGIIENLAQTNLLKCFNGFMIEWHRRGNRTPSELVSKLVDSGFEVICQPHPERSRGMIYAFRAS
jgi:FkbM family methyltransferase